MLLSKLTLERDRMGMIKKGGNVSPSGARLLNSFSLRQIEAYMHVKLTIIGSDNGSAPSKRQSIIGTNAEILLIRPLVTNFSEIIIGIQTFSFKKMHFEEVVCEMASILSRPQCFNAP